MAIRSGIGTGLAKNASLILFWGVFVFTGALIVGVVRLKHVAPVRVVKLTCLVEDRVFF